MDLRTGIVCPVRGDDDFLLGNIGYLYRYQGKHLKEYSFT